MGRSYTVSINMAPPWPPPIHSVAMPRLRPSRFIALTRCRPARLPPRADRMAKPDRAAVDIELVVVEHAGGSVEVQHLAAEFVVLPGRNATEHLGSKGFVQLPEVNVVEGELLTAQDRGRAQHRSQPHDGW